MSQNSSIFPDPEFELRFFQQLLFNNLFLLGGINLKDTSNKEFIEILNGFKPRQTTEIPTQDCYCFTCYTYLGEVNNKAASIPTICLSCLKKEANDKYSSQSKFALLAFLKCEGYSRAMAHTKVHNNLIKHAVKLRQGKGTWHKLNR